MQQIRGNFPLISLVFSKKYSPVKGNHRVRDCRDSHERAVPKEWSREAEPRKARPTAKRAGTPRYFSLTIPLLTVIIILPLQ